MFRVRIRIPSSWILVAGDIDLMGRPGDESSLDRDSHWVAVQQFEQIREFELRSPKVIEQCDWLLVVAVKPWSTWVSVQRLWRGEVLVHRPSLASPRAAPVNNDRTDPSPLDRIDQAVSIDSSLVFDEFLKVLVCDLTQWSFFAECIVEGFQV